jgi:hypothetical protein
LQQLGLQLRSKSARKGAGRKRLPAPARHTPRSQYVARVVLRAPHQSNSSCFRVVHHSVQANHLHLLVEAENKGALSSGMRGLVIRIARRVNQLLFHRGRFWADRWHGTTLTSPRQCPAHRDPSATQSQLPNTLAQFKITLPTRARNAHSITCEIASLR